MQRKFWPLLWEHIVFPQLLGLFSEILCRTYITWVEFEDYKHFYAHFKHKYILTIVCFFGYLLRLVITFSFNTKKYTYHEYQNIKKNHFTYFLCLKLIWLFFPRCIKLVIFVLKFCRLSMKWKPRTRKTYPSILFLQSSSLGKFK